MISGIKLSSITLAIENSSKYKSTNITWPEVPE